jgi:hypothetical protein
VVFIGRIWRLCGQIFVTNARIAKFHAIDKPDRRRITRTIGKPAKLELSPQVAQGDIFAAASLY